MKNIFILETLALFISIAFLPFAAFCQPADKGSLQYLLSTDGFGKIKLGADIKRLEQGKLSYMDNVDSLDADSCYKLCYNDDNLLDLGNGLSLNRVGLRTYKDKIVNIYLFFSRNKGYEILKDFEANYGKFTDSPGDFMYDWHANGLTLALRYGVDIAMGVAIFTSENIEKQLAEDDKKRREQQLHERDLLGAL
jgi:hypothetical protein